MHIKMKGQGHFHIWGLHEPESATYHGVTIKSIHVLSSFSNRMVVKWPGGGGTLNLNFREIEAIFPKTALKTALKIAIWVFFGGLKSKSGYFLGFSQKISDEHTYHFYIKSRSQD